MLENPDKEPESKPEPEREGMLRPSGGYRKLRSFQMAEIVFDATAVFVMVTAI